jgi:enterochelin esterase-like enzyme
MKANVIRCFSRAVAILLLVSAVPATAAASGGSQIVSTDLPLAEGSRELRRLNVYLPPNYDERAAGPGYPLLVMLHGSPGSAGDWLDFGSARATLDRLIVAGKLPPLVAAFPDGNGGLLRDTQFVNSADGREPVEDFIARVVPDYLRGRFSVSRDPKRTAIGGLSSGGFGALNIGLKHPDVFGCIISMSGYGLIDQNPFSAPFIGDSAELIARNSPLRYIASLPEAASRVLLVIGANDRYLEENHQLETALKGRGFDVEMMSFPGTHTWGFWRAHLEDALGWLAARLGAR